MWTRRHLGAWVPLHIPSPTRGIEIDADGVWYAVQDGDTLSSIEARLLGHPQRWQELFARNRGQAHTPDGRLLEDPNRIWKDLRLLLIPATAPAPATESLRFVVLLERIARWGRALNSS